MSNRERQQGPARPSCPLGGVDALLRLQKCYRYNVVSTTFLVILTRENVSTCRLMQDEDGPDLARWFYEGLFARETLDLDDIAYALDAAVTKFRESGVPASRWASFIHVGG
jgi:hypothetical protein